MHKKFILFLLCLFFAQAKTTTLCMDLTADEQLLEKLGHIFGNDPKTTGVECLTKKRQTYLNTLFFCLTENTSFANPIVHSTREMRMHIIMDKAEKTISGATEKSIIEALQRTHLTKKTLHGFFDSRCLPAQRIIDDLWDQAHPGV